MNNLTKESLEYHCWKNIFECEDFHVDRVMKELDEIAKDDKKRYMELLYQACLRARDTGFENVDDIIKCTNLIEWAESRLDHSKGWFCDENSKSDVKLIFEPTIDEDGLICLEDIKFIK